jgi:hypothetical protein
MNHIFDIPDNIPDNIKDKIILDSIILLKNNNGWKEINNRIKKPLRLRYVGSIYEPELKYHCIYRRYTDINYSPFEPFIY